MAIHLNPGQVTAVNLALDAYEAKRGGFVIKGEGGTGKTFSTSEFISILMEGELNVLMTAPTNKAVKQMRKSVKAYGLDLSRITFMTTHSALGLGMMPSEERKNVSRVRESCLSDYDIMVIDEGSMLNEYMLFNYLMPELEKLGMFVLIMGDHMQLPPVKEKESKAFSLFDSFELTQAERQQNNLDGTPNGILQSARRLRRCIEDNVPFKFEQPDHNVVAMRDREFMKFILAQFDKDTDLDEIRVLAWTNRSVNSINKAIRTNVYGKDAAQFEVGERITTGGPVVRGGEIILSTDEECIVSATQESSMFDEETGESWKTTLVTLRPLFADVVQEFVHVLHPDEQERYEDHLNAIVKRAEKAKKTGGNFNYHWRKYHQFKELFADLKYCWCMTVHRSQGSTYARVILDVKDILTNPVRSERQRLLYVGKSRPREELIINKLEFTA